MSEKTRGMSVFIVDFGTHDEPWSVDRFDDCRLPLYVDSGEFCDCEARGSNSEDDRKELGGAVGSWRTPSSTGIFL